LIRGTIGCRPKRSESITSLVKALWRAHAKPRPSPREATAGVPVAGS
jgi:hypothetical protein